MSRGLKRKVWEEDGFRCPYLDTINRMVLDFDFEKACSVCGNNFNVYACLICGKYFQGRGKHTQAYTHALQEGHHVYMNLQDGRTYCLPDGYEVVDSSLADIQNMLNPAFVPETVSTLDTKPVYARGVDGSDYMPGLIGLNNIKNTDFVNVVVQSLARVPPLRDYFLLPENYAHTSSVLVMEFGALIRKIWSPHNFKGQVSPHELLQAAMSASGNRFKIGQQARIRSYTPEKTHHALSMYSSRELLPMKADTVRVCRRLTRWISLRGFLTRFTLLSAAPRSQAPLSSSAPSRALCGSQRTRQLTVRTKRSKSPTQR